MSTSTSSSAGRQSFLIVFDFDHTVVNCNTDEVIPNHLGRGEHQRTLMQAKEPKQWTHLVDEVIAPFTREKLKDAAAMAVTMDEDMPKVFHFLLDQHNQHHQHNQEEEGNEKNENTSIAAPPVEIAIASDANLLFIESSIERHIPFVRHIISQIHSNPFHDVVGDDNNNNNNNNTRSCRLAWYEPNGHNCNGCNARNRPNMCKSRIIARLLHSTHLIDPTVIFIGDGANDLCPVLNVLRPRDYMFARRDFPIHRLLMDPQHNNMNSDSDSNNNIMGGGCCKIALWSNARELLHLFQSAMSPEERLPTLVRFRDAGPREFRSITLLERIPQVLRRTLKDNEIYTTETARQLIHALVEGTRCNAAVPPLPGQEKLPSWLLGYASTSEYHTDNTTQEERKEEKGSNRAISVSPRWGQIPWLHGEIYFYHLVAQYLMLADHNNNNNNTNNNNKEDTTTQEWVPNLVTPYINCTPIATYECTITTNPVLTATGIGPAQSFDPTFLAKSSDRTCVSDGVALSNNNNNNNMEKYHTIAAGDFLVPREGYFQQPYRDFFTREKHEVLHNFMRLKICPMLACVPWEADVDFIAVLLRWMLWGNGVDLSMFTLEQLQATHGTKDNNSGNESIGKEQGNPTGKADTYSVEKERIQSLRAAEAKTVVNQDTHIVGNQLEEVVQLVRHIIETEPTTNNTNNSNNNTNTNNTPLPRTIDIVMDNVGVECVADLIFTLWILQHHPSLCVTLHVKNMPYYVSDVTPPDFAYLIHQLEAYAQQEEEKEKESKTTTTTTTTTGRTTVKSVITPFVELVREALCNGRLRIDADTVWTQPCEYRELSPRVCNTFFFTQRLLTPAELEEKAEKEEKEKKNNNKGKEKETTEKSFSAVLQANTHYTPRSALVIFKGDLNFRRLVGDRHWDNRAFLSTLTPEELHHPKLSNTLLADTLSLHHQQKQKQQKQKEKQKEQEKQKESLHQYSEAPSFQHIISSFWPVQAVPVCAIRTVKSEGCVGVTKTQQDVLDRTDPAWKTSGKYGVILLAAGEKK